jgi:hypothetical protein
VAGQGLFRTVTRRRDGLTVLIDYTPGEAAAIASADSCRPDDHPNFTMAEVCIVRGGSLPQCQATPCVDYLLNSTAAGPGFGVLVGGGRTPEVRAIAARVARSLVAQ